MGLQSAIPNQDIQTVLVLGDGKEVLGPVSVNLDSKELSNRI